MNGYKNIALSIIVVLVSILIPVLSIGGDIKLKHIPLILFTVVVYNYVLKFGLFILVLVANEIDLIHKGLKED